MPFTPPLPSLASRNISLSARGSYRCTLVDHTNNRQIRCESRLERNVYMVILAHRDIESLHEQPPAVQYIDENGVVHEHTFDALVRMSDGTRIAIDVKPRQRVVLSGLPEVHRMIKTQVGSGFAHRYLIRTEDHAHPVDVANAELILRARRLSNHAADIAVRDLVEDLRGWCRFGDLIAISGVGANAFDALVRLIDEGVLAIRDRVRISYDCLVGSADWLPLVR